MNLHIARALAIALMHKHNLAGWSFAFDHARRRFGACCVAEKRITLSRHLTFLNPEDQVRDTILHEIAHALTPGDKHGPAWRRRCLEIGARPERCFTDDEVVTPPRRPAWFELGCAACNWWVDRRRRDRRKLICKRCGGAVGYRVKRATSDTAAPSA